MNLDDWSLEIQKMHQRVALLLNRSEQPKVQEDIQLVAAVFEELQQALEELQIAQEDLQEQNEELSKAQKALLLERQRYLELFEEAPEAYIVTDIQGIIQEVNYAATQLLNVSKSFLIGEPLDIYLVEVVEEQNQSYPLQISNLQHSASIQELEVKLQPRNRTPIIASARVAIIRHQQNQLIGMRWLLRDITSAKQTQEKLQRAEEAMRQALVKEKELSELKSHLLLTISHEFRNPLATIHSSAELLENYRHKWSDERHITHLRRIQQSAMHMSQLLDDFLILSQDSAAKLKFNPEHLDLVKFCGDLLAQLQQDEKLQHAIAFKSNSQSIQAKFDAKLLHYILKNLISNALKYSPNASKIDFSVTHVHNQAIIQIQDFGIGIPPHDIEHIFEPFHRASNVGNMPGMGLGMSIVKKALDLHGGEITVESSVGIGTTVILSFTVTGEGENPANL